MWWGDEGGSVLFKLSAVETLLSVVEDQVITLWKGRE